MNSAFHPSELQDPITAALRGGGKFVIIRTAIPIMPLRFPVLKRLFRPLAVGIVFCGIWSPATADSTAATPTPSEEALKTRQDILRTLQDVQRKYGRDAVLIEGHLLGLAVQAGSILEAAISVPGVEERSGKRFLTFKLDTGIIYNDRELTRPGRAARAWRDIVEGSLRKFRSLTVQADGLALLVGYTHKEYVDEAELRARLGEGHGESEATAFYLLIEDVAELLADRITGQQLIDRSTVLIDGSPARILLHPLESEPGKDAQQPRRGEF